MSSVKTCSCLGEYCSCKPIIVPIGSLDRLFHVCHFLNRLNWTKDFLPDAQWLMSENAAQRDLSMPIFVDYSSPPFRMQNLHIFMSSWTSPKTVGWTKKPLSPCLAPPVNSLAPSYKGEGILKWCPRKAWKLHFEHFRLLSLFRECSDTFQHLINLRRLLMKDVQNLKTCYLKYFFFLVLPAFQTQHIQESFPSAPGQPDQD